MKKRIVALLLAAIMVLMLVACSSGKTNQTEAPAANNAQAAAEKKFNIGILIFNYANDYINYVRQGIEKEATALGVTFQSSDAANNQPTQTEQVDTVLAKGVDGLAVALVESTAAATIIEKVQPSHTPVVFVNKQPRPEVLNTYDNCWFVGCATKMPGVQQMEMILDDFESGALPDKNGDGILQYVIIKGENGHENSEQRMIGYSEVLKARGYADSYDAYAGYLDLQVGLWSTQNGKDLMDAWVSKYGDQIEVVISQNDAMAFGAIESIKASGYKIAIYGINALEQALEKIEAGEMTGTVMTDMIKEGKITMDVLFNALKGVSDITEGIDATYEKENKCFRVDTVPIRLSNINDAWYMYR